MFDIPPTPAQSPVPFCSLAHRVLSCLRASIPPVLNSTVLCSGSLLFFLKRQFFVLSAIMARMDSQGLPGEYKLPKHHPHKTQRVDVATGSTHNVSKTPASQGVRTSPETSVVRELRAMSLPLSRPVAPICILSSFIFALL